MILPDSSVWIDHLRKQIPSLVVLLGDEMVYGHPFVTGEVSLGSIATRSQTISKLSALPQMPVQRHERVAHLIENSEVWGQGIGYVDTHLLASVKLVPGTLLWTRDKRLQAQAERLGVAYTG